MCNFNLYHIYIYIYISIIISLYPQLTNDCIQGRPAHGSVWVGFVPNPEPTRPDRVGKLSTRRRPLEKLVRTGWNINERRSGSVGVEIWKIKKIRLENDENRLNPLSFRRK